MDRKIRRIIMLKNNKVNSYKFVTLTISVIVISIGFSLLVWEDKFYVNNEHHAQSILELNRKNIRVYNESQFCIPAQVY